MIEWTTAGLVRGLLKGWPRDRGLDPRDRTNAKSLHVKPENVLGMAPLTLGTRNLIFVPSMALGDVKFNVLHNHLWVVFEKRSST